MTGPLSSPVGTIRKAGTVSRIKCPDGVWRYLHLVRMEELLGRPLDPWESVKWRSDDHHDCSPENLVLVGEIPRPEIAEAMRNMARVRRPRRQRAPRCEVQLGADLHAWFVEHAGDLDRSVPQLAADLLTAYAIQNGMDP